MIAFILSLDLEGLAEITRYHIADKFGVNQNYLSHKFKKHTKMSVLQFIDFVRISRAALLLRERPDLAISEISKKIGLQKCDQFRAKFRKKFFINPQQYRRIFIK